MSHPMPKPPQTTSSTHLRAPDSPASPPCSPPPITTTHLAFATPPQSHARSTPPPPPTSSAPHNNPSDPPPADAQPSSGPTDCAPPHQSVEPDADPAGIMQHPLWAQPGSQRLSSQDMEKHYSIDNQSHRPDDVRDKQMSGVKKDVGALFSLMVVAPFVGVAICFYALIIFVLISLAAPVLLAISGKTALKNRYLALLLPGLNLHYRMAYSARRCRVGTSARSWPGSVSYPQSPTSSNCSDLEEKPSPTPSIGHLMVVLLFSPVLSLPIALVNFVIMFFWFMSAVTESAGSSSSMDDGHMMAKRVRRFWIRWLSGELSASSGHSRRRKRGRPISRV